MTEDMSATIRLGLSVSCTACVVSTILFILIIDMQTLFAFQHKVAGSTGLIIYSTLDECTGKVVGSPVAYRLCEEYGMAFTSLEIKVYSDDTGTNYTTYNNPEVLLDHINSIFDCNTIGNGKGNYEVYFKEVTPR